MRERIGGSTWSLDPSSHCSRTSGLVSRADEDIVEAEAALDAEPVVIGGPSRPRIDTSRLDLMVTDSRRRRTGTAIHLPVRIGDAGLVFIEHHGWHQRAARDKPHTFAAGHAG